MYFSPSLSHKKKPMPNCAGSAGTLLGMRYAPWISSAILLTLPGGPKLPVVVLKKHNRLSLSLV